MKRRPRGAIRLPTDGADPQFMVSTMIKYGGTDLVESTDGRRRFQVRAGREELLLVPIPPAKFASRFEGILSRAAMWLLMVAANRLPDEARADRAAEWSGELHAIANDYDCNRLVRASRTLLYGCGLLLAARRHHSRRPNTLRNATYAMAGSMLASVLTPVTTNRPGFLAVYVGGVLAAGLRAAIVPYFPIAAGAVGLILEVCIAVGLVHAFMFLGKLLRSRIVSKWRRREGSISRQGGP